jgi:hypothetical protein
MAAGGWPPISLPARGCGLGATKMRKRAAGCGQCEVSAAGERPRPGRRGGTSAGRRGHPWRSRRWSEHGAGERAMRLVTTRRTCMQE